MAAPFDLFLMHGQEAYVLTMKDIKILYKETFKKLFFLSLQGQAMAYVKSFCYFSIL